MNSAGQPRAGRPATARPGGRRGVAGASRKRGDPGGAGYPDKGGGGRARITA